MAKSTLDAALKSFEATEANLDKLERVWSEISALIPRGIEFGSNPEYEDRCRSFKTLLQALPRIDGWKPESMPLDLDEIAQTRFDVLELAEPLAEIAVERTFEGPGEELREYRFRFNQKRRALIRDELISLIDAIDAELRAIHSQTKGMKAHEKVPGPLGFVKKERGSDRCTSR